ncbi:MAG: hypothetical protein U0667_07065 [Chloroflexota bacterium]
MTIEEMGWIVEAATGRGVDRGRLGVCLDTAHLWGAGYALDDEPAVDDLLAASIHRARRARARPSRRQPGWAVGRDRTVTSTSAWVASAKAGLGTWCATHALVDVPLILETPDLDAGWDALDMARVRALGAGGKVGVVRADGAGGAQTHMQLATRARLTPPEATSSLHLSAQKPGEYLAHIGQQYRRR